MRDSTLTFSLPRWRFTRWLTDVGHDVPDDIRAALIGSLYGTLPIFLGGVVNTISVAALIASRIPEPLFLGWLATESAICFARLIVLIVSRRNAATGRPTPTDLNLILAVAWSASVGFGATISLASGDWVAATLACLSAGAMVGGTCFRNFAAPRLAGLMIASTLGPVCVGAIYALEPILFVTLIQIPVYTLTMTIAAFRLNRMMVATMRAERENGFRARHDGLTGLSNRAGLSDAFDVMQSRPESGPVGLLYLDLDGFKSVNDTHGHAVGDRLLQLVGERLLDSTGPGDVAARIGGDEFIVLCQGRVRSDLIGLAERLIAQVSEPYACGPGQSPGQVIVGVSVGIAIGHGEELGGLMRAADAALYRSKSLGKGRCTLAPRRRIDAQPEAPALRRA